MKPLLAPFVLLATMLLAASPSPSPDPSPASSAAPHRLTVTCKSAPFFVFSDGDNRPHEAPVPRASFGQSFDLVSGPRTTLGSVQYYETNVLVVDPGYAPGAHYWLPQRCANLV